LLAARVIAVVPGHLVGEGVASGNAEAKITPVSSQRVGRAQRSCNCALWW
jgi:hypothetical protein